MCPDIRSVLYLQEELAVYPNTEEAMLSLPQVGRGKGVGPHKLIANLKLLKCRNQDCLVTVEFSAPDTMPGTQDACHFC